MLLTVLSAKGLAKVDYFVESNPFAVVFLNCREIGRTRTKFKTLDPVWSKPRETFFVRVTGDRHRSSVVVQLWDNNLGMPGSHYEDVWILDVICPRRYGILPSVEFSTLESTVEGGCGLNGPPPR